MDSLSTYILIQQLFNGITLGAIYALIAIGYTMVYGIIGMINFAHGEIYMISSYLTAIGIALMTLFGFNNVVLVLVVTLILTVVITSLYGISLERVAYKPLRRSIKLAPLITAIGMSLLLQNYVQIAQGARPKGIPPMIEGNVKFGNEINFAQITYTQLLILIAVAVGVCLLTLLINKTRLGRQCRATQQDIKMAAIMGINTDRVIMVVFTIGAAMAALGGFLVTLNYGSFDFFVGFVIGIKAFTAAVLGGIGSLPGALLGGLLLGMSESLFSGYINTDYKDVFAFSLLVLVLLFKPSGLLGKPEVQKV